MGYRIESLRTTYKDYGRELSENPGACAVYKGGGYGGFGFRFTIRGMKLPG